MAVHLQEECRRDDSIRNIEIIACLGRMLGYCIAMAFPDERDLARQTAIVNMDQATADVAQHLPTRPGVDQTGGKPE
jgi:imidazoleglycerol phosphate dehydratase HisB